MTTFQILSTDQSTDSTTALSVANDADVQNLNLDGVTRIDLSFPKFTDGRAFSQAFVLRRRSFKGDIRAHGDVLIDQLAQMQRCGFSSAVLRADQDAAHGQKLLGHYKAFYQGDAASRAPHFARA